MNAIEDFSDLGDPEVIEDFSDLGTPENEAPVEDFSDLGDPEPLTDGPGIMDDIAGVGRSLERGVYQADQAANFIGVINFFSAKRDLDAAKLDLQDYDAKFGVKPDPIGVIRRNRLNKVSRIAELEGEVSNRQGFLNSSIENIIANQKAIAATPTSPALKEFKEGNWGKALLNDPIEVGTSLMAESLPLSIPGMVAGSAMAGPMGTAVGAAAGSFITEYATSMLDSMQEAGINVGQPGWESQLTDEKLAAAAEFAVKRGVPVAVLDGISGGLAGRFLKPAIGKGAKAVLGASLKEGVTQAGSGMAGEALGQAVSGQPMNLRDIVAEGVAELPGGVVEVGKNVLEGGASGSPVATPPPLPGATQYPIDIKDIPAGQPTEQIQPPPLSETVADPTQGPIVEDFSDLGTPEAESSPQPGAEDFSDLAVDPQEAAKPATVGDIRTILGEYMSEAGKANLERRVTQQETANPPPLPDYIEEQNQQNAVEVTEDLAADLQSTIQGNQLSPQLERTKGVVEQLKAQQKPQAAPPPLPPSEYVQPDAPEDFNQEPRYRSETEPAPIQAIERPALESVVENIRTKLPQTPPITILENEGDAPAFLRYDADRLNTYWDAAITRDGIYLNRSRIQTPEQATKAILHEVVGHDGVKAVLQEEFEPTMRAVFRRYQNSPQGIEIADRYGLDLSDSDNQLEFAEEVIAQLAENPQSDPTLWQRIVAVVKRMWRKITNGDISDEEVRDLIRRAYKQQSAPTRSNTRFSLERESATAEAAREAGYTIGPVYHGSPSGGFKDFNAFRNRYGYYGSGIYFTSDNSIAEDYAKLAHRKLNKGKSKVYKVYLSIKNPLDMDAPVDRGAWRRSTFFQDGYISANELDAVKTNHDAYKIVENRVVFSEVASYDSVEIMSDGVKSMGFDGLKHIGGGILNKDDTRRHDVYIAFEPEQIKSAEDIERDDTGKQIPLEQRFNRTLADIRYSLSPDERKKRRDALHKIDELDKQKRAARKAGNAKEAVRLEEEIQRISVEDLGHKKGSIASEYIPDQKEVPGSESEPESEPPAAPKPSGEIFTPQLTEGNLEDTMDSIQSSSANPTEYSNKWLKAFRAQLKKLASSIPELPLNDTRFEGFRRWYRATKTETELSREKASKKVANILRPILELGRKVHDPNTIKEFEALTNLINSEAAKKSPNAARIEKLKKKRREMKAKIEQNPFWIFRNAVLWRDIAYRSNFLKNEDGGEIVPPGGMTKEQTTEAARAAMAAVKASPNAKAIEESLRRHYAFVTEMQDALEAAGEIIPDEMRNPNYYPHHILDKWTGKLSPVRATISEPFRYYLQPLTGSLKFIQSDYLQAMYKHASDVLTHNAQMRLIEKEIKPYDIAKEHQANLEKQYGKNIPANAWESERFLPKGYTFIQPDSFVPLSTSYAVDRNALSTQLGHALQPGGDLLQELKRAGLDLKISANDLRQAMTVGKPTKWLVPTEVADALNGIQKREQDANSTNIFGKLFGKVQKVWKWNTLFNPITLNWPRYEYGNIVTDVIDKVFGADPGSVKYLKRAIKEVAIQTETGETTPDLKAAQEQGVISTVTAAEADEVANLKEFAETLPDNARRLDLLKRALSIPVGISHWREASFRYAKFLADMDRIRRGERPVYAGAYWKDVEAQTTPAEKAGLITRKTFGDYQDISITGQWLRKYLFPFWSWSETNLKYHANLFRNMADMVRIGDITGTGRSARAAAIGIAMRLALIRAGVELWNAVGGQMMGLWDDDDDLESQVSETDRRRMHLIMGKDENGEVRLIYLPNALGDVAEWIGGNNFARLFMEWAKGDITLEEFASDYAKQMPADFINKVAQGIRPEAKAAYTINTGLDPFPDVTNQRKVDNSQWGWIIAQSMDRDIATALRSQIDPDFYAPESFGDWWQRKILQVRRRDPEQWAYYESRDKASEWKFQKTGKKNEGFDYKAPDQTVLRNFRKAIYRGDVENAARFYSRALELGYTAERFQASIRNGDPLSDLTKEQRKEYLENLSPHDKRMLEFAYRYYARMANFKGDEKKLFPKAGQKFFTPRHDLLESTAGRLSEEEAEQMGRKLMERR